MRTKILSFVCEALLFVLLMLRAEGFRLKLTQISLGLTYIYIFSEFYMCEHFRFWFKSPNNVTPEDYL